MSGAPWGYENWGPDEPNQNGNEDCTALDSQAESYGVSCKLYERDKKDKVDRLNLANTSFLPHSPLTKGKVQKKY